MKTPAAEFCPSPLTSEPQAQLPCPVMELQISVFIEGSIPPCKPVGLYALLISPQSSVYVCVFSPTLTLQTTLIIKHDCEINQQLTGLFDGGRCQIMMDLIFAKKARKIQMHCYHLSVNLMLDLQFIVCLYSAVVHQCSKNCESFNQILVKVSKGMRHVESISDCRLKTKKCKIW